MWRRLGQTRRLTEPVGLHAVQRLGPHLLGDPADSASKLRMSFGTVQRGVDDQCRPFVGDAVESLTTAVADQIDLIARPNRRAIPGGLTPLDPGATCAE
jgi:hypothetical protein